MPSAHSASMIISAGSVKGRLDRLPAIMFRIRRIYDDLLPVNRTAIAEVQQILSDQFSGAPRKDINELPCKLRNPLQSDYRTALYVAENSRGRVTGFALVLQHLPLRFCYVDYIATVKGIVGRGIGAALYERVRDDALSGRREGAVFRVPAGCAGGLPRSCYPQAKRCPASFLRAIRRSADRWHSLRIAVQSGKLR